MSEQTGNDPSTTGGRPTPVGSAVAAAELPPPAAALRGVSKIFGATRALTNMTVVLRPGRVTALVGENGAGKSTCVKTLSGLYKPDGGHVELGGEEVALTSPLDARARGIAVVSQHPSLFGDLSLAENIFAGQELRTARGILDHGAMRTRAKVLLQQVGLDHDPATPASRLSTSEHQMLEIAKALAVESRILILDEPTATLSSGEVDRLFAVIDDLRARGVAMLFVGHRLEEIFHIADDLVIMRDGQLVHTCLTSELTPDETINYMVGRELGDLYPDRAGTPGDVVLEVSGLSTVTGLEDVSLQVRAGEVVGLAGLVGSGRTELARVIFGIDRATSGTIELDGRQIRPTSSAEAMSYGIAYVSEDRRGQSVIEDFDILENSTLPVIAKATRHGLIARARQLSLISEPLKKMSLKFASYGQAVRTLSGGNQQKVVIAKWLATNPRLLILDEPTQGIDVGAKAEVHRLVADLAAQGIGVLMISSDLPEVLGMSDRVLVMRSGRLVAEFGRDEASEESIARAATGAGEAQSSRPEGAGPALAAEETPGLLTLLMQRRELGLLAVLIAVSVIATVVNSNFLTYTNLSRLAAEASLVGIVALGQFLVILTRNIDVSVASTIGLAAFIFGDLVRDGTPLLVAALLTLVLGLVLGLVNGLVVAYGNVPSIVVTLGTLYVYRGIDAILSNGDQISPGTIPAGFAEFVESKPLGIPMLTVIFLVLAVVLAAALTWTAAGRQFFQVGSNPEGARAIGLNVERKLLAAFVTCGILAALAGVLWATHYGAVDGQTAYGEELRIIAAVVVGGVALRGGRGTVLGVALGTLVLFTLYNALTLARVDPLAIQAFYGAAIILAVAFDSVLSRRSAQQKTVI
ncbi:ATP-binding cassette domain-containing protein [Nocardioides sp.]|uniref:ATP-binding cassette domain-containing protein n=1 Tax=Nocardioides sp. TaxID=35761 RepID=UPI0039E43338